jgi:ATP-binding cassette subfamily C protein
MAQTQANLSSGTGADFVLRGSAALLLERAGAAWLVESGKVAVFRTRAEGGRSAGVRRYVFTCHAGEALFDDSPPPSAAGNGHDGSRFVAVPLEDSRLRKVPLTDLAAAPGRPDGRPHDALEKWVEKVTDTFLGDFPPDPAANAGTGDLIHLTHGQVFRAPAGGVSWVRVEQGLAAVLGREDMRVGPEAGPIPLGSGAWLTAVRGTRLRVLKTGEAVEAGAVGAGLAWLHDLCFACLEERERRVAVQELARLQERRRLEDQDTARALNELRKVLDASGQAVVGGETELLTALAALEPELGTTFKAASRGTPLKPGEDPLPGIARASRVRIRHVLLREGWQKTDAGPLLGYLGEEKAPVALVRDPRGRYEVFDPRERARRPLDAATLARLGPQAVVFYKPFPQRPLGLFDVWKVGLRPYLWTGLWVLALSLGGTLLGMLPPQAMRWIFDYSIPDADRRMLTEYALALVAIAWGQASLSLVQGIATLRLRSGATATLQAATWDRLLRLPTRFFRRYATGDLLNRAMMITEVSQEISGTAMRSLVTGATTLLNLGLMFYYSTKLAWVGVVAALIAAVVTALLSAAVRRRALALQQLDGRQYGFVVQLINGIAKLRVAGAERRAYNHWARRYAEQLRLTSGLQLLHDLAQLFNFLLPTAGIVAIFWIAAKALAEPPADAKAAGAAGAAALSLGSFMAFYSAFGTFIHGASDVSTALVDILGAAAKRRLMKPILEAEPEVEASRVDPGRLVGAVRLERVVFRYRENGPVILNEVTLQAEPGEFIALVGPSGSGKSTVLRLLLGFESCEAGAVQYDGRDLTGLDLTAVRQQIGVVLQFGRINTGSIYDNVAAGNLVTLDEAWQALRDAGLAEDVSQMPMGVHTFISEGGGNLSGGQRQRLMIARALVMNPRLLYFDEATSALDNATQAIVNASVARRKVTRVVVAHRLSTVRDADRIYVLDAGQVIQLGTFDELCACEGLFKRMMERQQI